MRLNIQLDLTSEQVHQQLMTGIDRWVQLGLLSEAQVKEIAAVLSQPLPEVARSEVARFKVAGEYETASQIAEPSAAQSVDQSPESVTPLPPQVSWVSRSLSALIEEISVIWLLVLGVFLVVVSSGVLAASQWESFSAVGQYGILLAYTLAFWAASSWAQRQENLQSTGRMLALTTLLLVPVNFWVIDRFGVLTSPLGIGIGVIAAIALTYLPFALSTDLMPRRLNRLNLLGLSWLHWGWGLGSGGAWAVWPVIATYLGTIGTAANLTAQDRQQSAIITTAATAEAEASEEKTGLSFGVLTVALSVLLLLVRSLWIAQVPPHQLGLAAGICGWLLVWLTREKHSQRVWEEAGFGLLLLGWLASVSQSPPWQAIAISLLTVSLLWQRLRKTWHRFYLFALLGVGLQTYGLIWPVLPVALRDRLLSWLAIQFNVGTVTALNWAGIGLFPYLLLMLVFARYLRRQPQNSPQNSLSQITQQLALVLGFGLTIISAGNPFTAAVILSLSTLTLIAVLRRQPSHSAPSHSAPSHSAELMALAQGAGLLAITSWIHYFAPELSLANWARIALGMAIAHFVLHLGLRHPTLQRNFWWAGLGLAVISYGLLINSYDDQPHWLWLLVPVTLTLVAHHRQAPYPQMAAGIAIGTLVLHVPWMDSWTAAIAALTIGTLCAAFNSRLLRDRYSAFFTVGVALLLAGSLAWVGLIRQLDNSVSRMMIFWVIEIGSLWLIQRGLMRRSNEMALVYVRATRIWAALMLAIFLLWGTIVAATTATVPVLTDGLEITHARYLLAATCILITALIEFIRYRPMEWRYYSLALAVEIALIMALQLQGFGPVKLGIVTLALALVVQIVADIWVKRRPPYRNSWHAIPLAYAGIGWLLGHLSFQANTGFFTLAVGVLLLGIGRRRTGFEGFSYAGLLAVSAGTYELLVYKLLQASGGFPGDGITLLAGLALAIAALYQLCRPWAPTFLKLSAQAISLAGQGHWAIGSFLCLFAAVEGLSQPRGIALWTGCSLLLAGYALLIGNRRWSVNTFSFSHAAWTSIGLAGALLCIAYDRYVWFPDRARLFTWGGVIACTIGLALYTLPWERLGWAASWRRLGLWLPMLTLSITLGYVQTQGLLIVAAFYAWMAKQSDRVRLSYFSLLLLDFSLLDYLSIRGWLTHITLGLMFGLSVLYIAEVEPYLQENGGQGTNNKSAAKRQQRHWLRMLASGLIGLSALYQTEISAQFLGFAAIAVLIGIALIFAGLILKVRAFLYIGTATFIAQILRVLWLFVSANSLLLWAVGIVLGLIFIWVAATFESRRSQLGTQLSSWTSALENWN
ncbi:MAG: hypothetical protein WA984_10605 [Phormidesmis sp.]